MQITCKLTDQELIELYSNGDEDALAELVNRHKDKLFTSIVLLVRDQYLAEDIFQETFIKIIDTVRSGRYTEKGKFLPWAIRIAHNLCVDHFRRIKRTPIIRTSDDKDIFNVLPFAEPCAEEVIMTRQSHESVRKMLNLLPAEQREVIILRHYGGLSFKEIADQTHVSINTALGRMRYGLINLRKMIAEKQICL
ncbi:MAG: RNA polymerase sigma factor [Chitinophagaceae bacterium]